MSELTGDMLRSPGQSGNGRRKTVRNIFLAALLLLVMGGLAYLYWPQVKKGGSELFERVSQVFSGKPQGKPLQPVVLAVNLTQAEETKPDLPAAEADKAEAPAPADSKYVVREGDTLGVLFGRNAKAVCELNKLANCDRIVPDQVLKLPEGVEAKTGTQVRVSKPKPKRVSSAFVTKPKVAKAAPTEPGVFYWKKVGGAPLKGCGGKDDETLNEEAWTKLGLSDEEKAELRAKVALESFEHTWFKPGMRLPAVAFCKKGEVVFRENVVTAWSESEVVIARTYVLHSGRRLHHVRNCNNWVPDVSVPVAPVAEAAQAVPTDEAVPTPAEEAPPAPPISAFPKEDIAEWEAIVGAGVWDNKLAHGNWRYGEAALMAILPDGYRLGGGVYGMWGGGSSDTSDYSWRERGYGPQVVLKKNFLREQTDEFGQSVLLPAMWGLKLRYIPNDHVHGSNPVSGYANTQDGKKLGLYAEYLARTSPDWLLGITGEVWHSFDRRIKSTWSGDKPQDRGSLAFNLFQQYRINDNWQVRFVEGASHQNWDKLNFLNLHAEARYQETFMFGPRISFALNKPDAYKNVARGDLTTIGAFVRAEFGDTFRTWDRKYRESTVQQVGPVSEQQNE